MSSAGPDLSALMGGGGAPPPDASGAGGPQAGPSVTSPPSGDASDTLRQIIDLFNVYMQEETDNQDLAEASDLQARVQKLLSSQEQLVDKATGAGPGARMQRKATQSQSGGGASGY